MKMSFHILNKYYMFTIFVFCISCTKIQMEISEHQPNDKIIKANFTLADKWSVKNQNDLTENLWIHPFWIKKQNKFLYRHWNSEETSYYLIDPSKKAKEELFDRKNIANKLHELSGNKYDWKRLPINKFELEAGDSALVFAIDDKQYSLNIFDKSLVIKKNKPDIPNYEYITLSESPDAQSKIILRFGTGIFLARKDTQADTLIFTEIPFEQSGEDYDCSFAWSGDSRRVAFLVEDWTKVEDLWLINPLATPRPTLETFKWPMPNENVEQYSLWIYDCELGNLIKIETDRWADQTIFQAQWSPDSKKLYYQRLSRDWLKLDLCVADPITGENKVLIEERGFRQFYYPYKPPYRVLKNNKEIIWWSWSEGWGHYYLYSTDGTLKAKTTSGSYNAGEIIFCDEDKRILYFMGNAKEKGRNPYNHYLYRVNFDGSQLQLVTPEDAEHKIYMSNSGDFFVDNYSRPDLEPHTAVRNSQGELIMELESADIIGFESAGWQKPEIFKAFAADNSTELWGVLFKPYDFDPNMKYPTIVYGYPGKETEFIPLKFYNNNWITLISTALAQYGFIVAVFGNRGGTLERSYEYYNYGWDDLRNYPIADKIHVMKQLAKERKYIDIDRVGVMGSSSGGFFAAAAILAEPEFFKVAVAKSGNHDNNLYYHHWNERYGKVKELIDENGQITFESYSPSNNEIAGNLNGRLLLVQGDMDRYVPPSQTSRLANSLIEANRRFDQFIVPGGDHFFGKNWQYLIRYIELYFVENLMGDDRWSVDIFKNMDSIVTKKENAR